MSSVREEVLAQVVSVLRKHAKGPVKIAESTALVADLGIDSLGVMEALADVEDCLGITFDDHHLQQIATLGELVDLAVTLRAEQG